MPASPLRKKLIDSGLGEDLAGFGLETELKQMFYSTGLRGISARDTDKVEDMVLSTLEDLASSGLDPDIVEAAMNTVEFHLRENNTGSFPRGLAVMLRSLTTWLYDGAPFDILHFEPQLKEIRKRLENGETLFEDLIRKHFLDNPHRTTLELHPDTELEERMQKREEERLKEIKKDMDDSELGRVLTQTRTLRDMQAAPDKPENLAKIPRLNREDLDKEIKKIPMQKTEVDGVPVLTHEQPASGIVYLDLGLNTHLLPQKYVPYIPLFGRALLETGTDREDFVQLTTRIRRECGGLDPVPFSHQVRGQKDSSSWLFLRGKALADHTDKLLGILTDVLTSARLDNRERFRQIVLEEKAGLEQMLIPAGHQVVGMRLKARFTEAGWVQEHMRHKPSDISAPPSDQNRFRLGGGPALPAGHPAHPGEQECVYPQSDRGKKGPGKNNVRAARIHFRIRGQGDFAYKLDSRLSPRPRGNHPPRPGQLRGQGGQPVRRRIRVSRRGAGGLQIPAHRISVGENPGHGRGLRSFLPLRPSVRADDLSLLPRPQCDRNTGRF
jgi:hypothetical protein